MARKSTQALADELRELLNAYSNKISCAEVVGVLVIQAVHIALGMDEDDGDE